jgi:predicted aspartyl protease
MPSIQSIRQAGAQIPAENSDFSSEAQVTSQESQCAVKFVAIPAVWAASLRISMALLLLLCSCEHPSHPKVRDQFQPDLTATDSPITVPMTEDGNLQWRVLLMVNDELGLFAVDTGAEKTVISREFASKLGVMALPESGRVGKILATDYRVPLVKVISLKMGTFTYSDFYAPVLDLSHINNVMHTRIDGILGNNILCLTRCDFDFRKNTLVMDAAGYFRPAGAIPVTLKQNRMFVTAQVNRQSAEFELDTGSFSTCMTESLVSRLRIPADSKTNIMAPRVDIFGAAQLRQLRVTLDSFDFSRIHKQKLPVMQWKNTVLGMDVLQQWKLSFDMRAGWVMLGEYPP